MEYGHPQRWRVAARWHSYHGNTPGALSVTGRIGTRKTYLPLLINFPHFPPPYCYGCPYDLSHPECGLKCAQALEIANRTQYALTGSVFSRSPDNIAQAKREFRVGNLYINRGCTGAIVGRHPFGGFKMSGIGSKAGGPDYLRQFMVPRNIAENTLRRGFIPIEE